MGSPPISSGASSARFALIILDGLGDLPHPDTGNRSPVEAAQTPNLDLLAARGQSGEVVLIGPGIAPESDAGVLALLGYDPVTDSPGRGVLEALGIGVPLEPGDVAFRMNFATQDGSGAILDSRVGRSLSTHEASELARSITGRDLLAEQGIQAEIRPTVGHRGVLWLHPRTGGPLSPHVSNSDPFYDRQGGMGHARKADQPTPKRVEALEPGPGPARTAAAVNRFLDQVPPILAGSTVNARRAMGGKPMANAILLRHGGRLPDPPPVPFAAKYGLEGAAITEMPVERGIAHLLGLEDRYVGPMGADRDAALQRRARLTREMLERHPFVYVHLKGPDEPGHDGRATEKKEIIEALDRSFFAPFLAGLDWSSTRVAVTADHATPCILKSHSDDPVPLVLAGQGVAPDGPPASPRKFGGSSSVGGSLGCLRGREVLARLLGRPLAAAA